MSKPVYHAVSFSGGKDSTAMVLHMIDLGYKIDEVFFCDTGMEFPGMLRHIEKIKAIVEANGLKFVTLRPEHSFEWYLAEKVVSKRKEGSDLFGLPGYGWPTPRGRWCTRHLKLDVINKHLKELQKDHTVVQYLGIAADEQHRLSRKNNQDKQHQHPLVEWGWTEKDAMDYCRRFGFDWGGLYDMFGRVSCWCCPLQRLDHLRKLRRHLPELWQELIRLDKGQAKTFKPGTTVEMLDKRFALEDALVAAGHSIKSPAFFDVLKRHLAGETSIEDIPKELVGDNHKQLTFSEEGGCL